VPRAMQDAKKRFVVHSHGSPRGSKIELKLTKTVIEIQTIFDHDFEMVVYRFWVELGSKNLSKIGGLRAVISGSLRIREKYDFLNNPLSFLLDFSTLKASNFDLKACIFQLFFRW